MTAAPDDVPNVLQPGQAWTREALNDEATMRRFAQAQQRGTQIDLMGLALDVLGEWLVPDGDERLKLAKHFREVLNHILDQVEEQTSGLLVAQADVSAIDLLKPNRNGRN